MSCTKISVVVPVYNGAKYILGLWSDFEAQTFRDFEVIFVNDGSTDESQVLIDNCLKKNIECKVLIEENLGQGLARNVGMNASSGEYIVFIDQDDHVPSDYLMVLWEKATSDKSDIVVSGYSISDCRGRVKKKFYLPNSDWAKFMCNTPWGKIYRKSFLLNNNITFLKLPLGEDIYFNVLAYAISLKEKTVISVLDDYCGYRWVENELSFSRTVHRIISKESDVTVLFEKLLQNNDIYKAISESSLFRYFLLKVAVFHLLYVAPYNKIYETVQYKRRIFEWLKQNAGLLYENDVLQSIKGPRTERLFVRICVSFYLELYRIKCDSFFLVIYSGYERLRLLCKRIIFTLKAY